MEHVLLWYKSHADRAMRENDSLVSSIRFDKFLGKYPLNVRGTAHVYEAAFSQLADPTLPYGQLLARQDILATDHIGDEQVILRAGYLLLNVAPPTREESQLCRAHKLEPPELLLVDAPLFLREWKPGNRTITEYIREVNVASSLSDLEVDRLWDLGSALIRWIAGPALACRIRNYDKDKMEASLDEASRAVDEVTSELERSRTALLSEQAKRATVQAAVSSAKDILDAAERDHRNQLGKANSAVTLAKNEIGRLRGVHLQILRQSAGTIKTDGECPDSLEARVVKIQQQREAAPQVLKDAEAALEALESQWPQRRDQLSANLTRAEAAEKHQLTALAPFEDEVAKIGEKLASAQTALRRARNEHRECYPT